jgi:tRNA-dihydrouridine synthase B
MMRATRCHAVMVGRAATGDPWLFEAMDAAEGLRAYAPPTLAEIFATVERHIADECRLKGERIGSQVVRKHVVRYFRGFPGAAAIRRRLFATETGERMLAVLAEVRGEADLRQRADRDP